LWVLVAEIPVMSSLKIHKSCLSNLSIQGVPGGMDKTSGECSLG